MRRIRTTTFNEYYQIGSTCATHDDNGNQTGDGAKNMFWDAMNRFTKWTTASTPDGDFWRYVYDAENRRVAKYFVHYEGGGAMPRDGEAKLYCAGSGWTRGEGSTRSWAQTVGNEGLN